MASRCAHANGAPRGLQEISTGTMIWGTIGSSAIRERPPAVPKRQRIGNLIGVTVPFAGFVLALGLSWRRLIGVSDVTLLAVMYTVSALGATLGFHRLLTHRSFETYRSIKYVHAVLGSLSVQGPVLPCVAIHRQHDAHAE